MEKIGKIRKELAKEFEAEESGIICIGNNKFIIVKDGKEITVLRKNGKTIRVDKEGQVEEMTNILIEYTEAHHFMTDYVMLQVYARLLFDAGFRKE